jgi:cbb3-type cytochrome oxidase maturation protein
MSAVYIALPVALLLAVAGVIAFIWAARSGQLDDLETPGQRVLFDDEEPQPPRRDGAEDPKPEV